MRFIEHTDSGWQLDAYLRYVREQKQKLPAGARDFIFQDWHYDIAHHQCPHDSWVENVIVQELLSGERRQLRSLTIAARFLGAYHDGYFELTYDKVSTYGLHGAPPSLARAHGDWIIDEITIAESGGILHEIQFAHGFWSILCSDLHYRWHSGGDRNS